MARWSLCNFTSTKQIDQPVFEQYEIFISLYQTPPNYFWVVACLGPITFSFLVSPFKTINLELFLAIWVSKLLKGWLFVQALPLGTRTLWGYWVTTQSGSPTCSLTLPHFSQPGDKGHLPDASFQFLFISFQLLFIWLSYYKQKFRRQENNLLQHYLEQRPGPLECYV